MLHLRKFRLAIDDSICGPFNKIVRHFHVFSYVFNIDNILTNKFSVRNESYSKIPAILFPVTLKHLSHRYLAGAVTRRNDVKIMTGDDMKTNNVGDMEKILVVP